VFIGLENINSDNLIAAKKRQKIVEYRKMLAWKAQAIITLAGYILGFPADTSETIRRDIEIIKRELAVDMLKFFCLTPIPGSEDHQKLWRSGIAMDADLNRYDLEHVCAGHPRMSQEEWERIYQETWRLYYTPDHMKTLLKRAAATGVPMRSLATLLFLFATTMQLERVHPLQGGILRLKHPSELRAGLERPPAWLFWLRFAGGATAKYARVIAQYVRVARWRRAIERDGEALSYGSGVDTCCRRRRGHSRPAHENRWCHCLGRACQEGGRSPQSRIRRRVTRWLIRWTSVAIVMTAQVLPPLSSSVLLADGSIIDPGRPGYRFVWPISNIVQPFYPTGSMFGRSTYLLQLNVPPLGHSFTPRTGSLRATTRTKGHLV
jgi:hypothetical protein